MKTKYAVVTELTAEALAHKVEVLLNEGEIDDPSWDLQGGVCSAYYPGIGTFYSQALVKWVPDKEDVEDALTWSETLKGEKE